jgi:hypothetical protein
MWILMLLIVTSKGELIMYDQGIFETMDECISVRVAMEKDMKETDYRLTCFKWDNYGK